MKAQVSRLCAVASTVLFGSATGATVTGGRSPIELANAAIKDSRLSINSAVYNFDFGDPISLDSFGTISDLDADKFSGAILSTGRAAQAVIGDNLDTNLGYFYTQVPCAGRASREYAVIIISLTVPPGVSDLVIRYQVATQDLSNHNNHHWVCITIHYIFDQNPLRYYFFVSHNFFENFHQAFSHNRDKARRVCATIYYFVVVFRNCGHHLNYIVFWFSWRLFGVIRD
ncbi:hypothetical protein EsH8_II_001169 [Colletotrichum jinshuiense]